ncbi:MAG: hypothetical protein HEQ29_23335 [Dolichospermum sp. LBC05a]|nr:hypothetical protein [Dolichospermum sp. OL01]MCO5799541.1 hypothetical protein [Dolichospermum sp. OL03]MCS6279369.1 hypothetical protein [Dolichospermum sp.]QSV60879.1 MAG: hypothetical protein HEQ29_23335 [Dolichospermum sp. LBC05a]
MIGEFISDIPYKPSNLIGIEKKFQPDFDKLVSEFGNDCDIFIRKYDYGRMMAAGIVNRYSNVAITIPFIKGNIPLEDPLNTNVLNKVKNHFMSKNPEDLIL